MVPCLNISGVVPGSQLESETVESLARHLKETVDQVYSVEIPVYTWIHDCIIEVNGESHPCIHMPYSSSAELTFDPREVILIRDINELGSRIGQIRDKIVFIPYPGDTYLTRLLSILLARSDVKSVIYFTDQDEVLKADVVHASMKIDYSPASPIDTPVITIDHGTLRWLTRYGGSLRAMGRLARSTGRIIIGYVNGDGERNIHIIGHHDSILGSFEQSPSRLLEILATLVRELPRRRNIIIVSSTARELGDYEFTSYHYTWGERYLLRILESKGELERSDYSIAIGHLSGKGSLRLRGHGLLLKHFNFNVEGMVIDENYLFSEAYPYIETGIPSFAIADEYSELYRNSTLSPESDVFMHQAKIVADMVVDFISRFKLDHETLDKYRRLTLEQMNSQELERRVLLTRTWDLYKMINDPWSFIKTYTRLAHDTFYAVCPEQGFAYVEASLWASMKPGARAIIREIGKKCNREYILGSRSIHAHIVKAGGEHIEIMYRQLSRHVINYLSSKIDEIISSLICRQHLRVPDHVEKSNRDR